MRNNNNPTLADFHFNKKKPSSPLRKSYIELETEDDPNKSTDKAFSFPFDESATSFKPRKSEIKRQQSYNEVRELRDTVFQLFSDEFIGKKSQQVVRISPEEDSNVLVADTPVNKRSHLKNVENTANYAETEDYVYIKLCE